MNNILTKENICILIYNARITLRRVKYLNSYINKYATKSEEIIDLTGSNRGLAKYDRRLVRILNSLIRMLDSDDNNISKIIGKSDKIYEVVCVMNELEDRIESLSHFSEKPRLSEKLRSEKF
jgi:hypothetical protein